MLNFPISKCQNFAFFALHFTVASNGLLYLRMTAPVIALACRSCFETRLTQANPGSTSATDARSEPYDGPNRFAALVFGPTLSLKEEEIVGLLGCSTTALVSSAAKFSERGHATLSSISYRRQIIVSMRNVMRGRSVVPPDEQIISCNHICKGLTS